MENPPGQSREISENKNQEPLVEVALDFRAAPVLTTGLTAGPNFREPRAALFLCSNRNSTLTNLWEPSGNTRGYFRDST